MDHMPYANSDRSDLPSHWQKLIKTAVCQNIWHLMILWEGKECADAPADQGFRCPYIRRQFHTLHLISDLSGGTAFPTRLHVRPAMTQISLLIHAIWSESSSSRGSKASSGGQTLISLRGRAGWSEFSLDVYAIKNAVSRLILLYTY